MLYMVFLLRETWIQTACKTYCLKGIVLAGYVHYKSTSTLLFCSFTFFSNVKSLITGEPSEARWFTLVYQDFRIQHFIILY